MGGRRLGLMIHIALVGASSLAPETSCAHGGRAMRLCYAAASGSTLTQFEGLGYWRKTGRRTSVKDGLGSIGLPGSGYEDRGCDWLLSRNPCSRGKVRSVGATDRPPEYRWASKQSRCRSSAGTRGPTWAPKPECGQPSIACAASSSSHSCATNHPRTAPSRLLQHRGVVRQCGDERAVAAKTAVGREPRSRRSRVDDTSRKRPAEGPRG